MGGLYSRNKGKSGERELLKQLQPIVDAVYRQANQEPPILRRNLQQAYKQKDNHDIIGLDWIAIEVKRHEQLNINSWWEQAEGQARENQIPVLFFRQNNSAWRVMMNVVILTERHRIATSAIIDMVDFQTWFALQLEERLGLR